MECSDYLICHECYYSARVILIPNMEKGSALATVIAQVIVPAYLFTKGQKVYLIPYKFAVSNRK